MVLKAFLIISAVISIIAGLFLAILLIATASDYISTYNPFSDFGFTSIFITCIFYFLLAGGIFTLISLKKHEYIKITNRLLIFVVIPIIILSFIGTFFTHYEMRDAYCFSSYSASGTGPLAELDSVEVSCDISTFDVSRISLDRESPVLSRLIVAYSIGIVSLFGVLSLIVMYTKQKLKQGRS